ncbi:hypothetical protein [Nocardia sp. XZ_19_369]|uniref:hypothetical protein n=1 Tax=Nocardia sp. XZ_19_369 TaxID=2769487 RepID=UPI0018908B18|nr:hypothetical protein [Nocardia sp. XZ_19_369]
MASILAGIQPASPASTASAILQVVDADEPPFRIILGTDYPVISEEYLTRLVEWQKWQPVSVGAVE